VHRVERSSHEEDRIGFIEPMSHAAHQCMLVPVDQVVPRCWMSLRTGDGMDEIVDVDHGFQEEPSLAATRVPEVTEHVIERHIEATRTFAPAGEVAAAELRHAVKAHDRFDLISRRGQSR
jgi:hypothetical protein